MRRHLVTLDHAELVAQLGFFFRVALLGNRLRVTLRHLN